MSNELIEKLREYADGADTPMYVMGLMNEAADALEAKAAPVGEREAFESWWRAVGLNDGFISYWSREAFQAGAAYQRAQQPQSAEAVAFYWQDVGYKNPNRHGPYFGRPTEAALRNVDGGAIPVLLYTTPQPSAGVVMPERNIKQLASVLYQACGAYDMPERVLDLLSAAANGEDFEHLIDGVLPCCPQTNAGARIPDRKERPYGFTHMPSHYEGWNACLDEFARLNGKEVGRG